MKKLSLKSVVHEPDSTWNDDINQWNLIIYIQWFSEERERIAGF